MAELILTVAEYRAGGVAKPALEALGEARRLASRNGGRVAVVAIGAGAAGAVETLGQHGADEVYVFDHADLAAYNLEAYAACVLKVAREQSPAALLIPATVHGREMAAWVAAGLQVGLASDVVELTWGDGGLTAVRPMYAGKVRTTVAFDPSSKPQIATLRPNIFAVSDDARAASAIACAFEAPAGMGRCRLVETKASGKGAVDLTEARVVVAGGRGLKGPEHFEMLEQLADALGGAVGATRMVVDLGWKDHAMQVGQTGKIVNPELYIAVGISGAIQHLVGMQTSKTIVAINKDAEAPIFKIADYGIVGDAFEVVPALTNEVRKTLSPAAV